LPTTDDHALAAHIAERSGRALIELRAHLASGPPRALGAEGDRRSHDLILAALAEARPADAVLSEEAAADPARLGAERVWIVDPLDGTREYSEGRSDFAVHVALVMGAEPVAGAVALPGEDVVLATAAPGRPGPVLAPRAPGALRIVVSRTRPPAEAERAARRLGAELVPLGSAGAKTMAVVRGHADVYLHAGGQYEWDSAAPVAVARAAGAFASRLDGSPLVYNRPDPWLPDLVVCRPELAATVIEAARP